MSRSSIESEYRALADEVAEVMWVESMLKELQVPYRTPSTVFCDNLSTIQLAADPMLHARTKHVEIDYYFARERVMNGALRICHVSSENQLADPLTKVIPTQKFLTYRSKLSVLHRPVRLRGDDGQRSSSRDELLESS